MRDIAQISEDIIKYLRQGGSAAELSIKTLNKEIKALLLEVNKKILAGDTQRSIEAYIRAEIKDISSIVEETAIAAAVLAGTVEARALQKSIAAIAEVPQKQIKKIVITDAYIRKVMRQPLQTANYTMEDAFKTVGVNLSRNTVSVLRRSYNQGSTAEEISAIFMKSIKEVDVAKANRNLNTIVRTAVSQVANSVRMDTYKANKNIDRVLYVAVLDSRTSSFCAIHDGRVYKMTDIKPTLPAHFNCRSTYVPILKTETAASVKDQIQRPKDANGNYMNYEDWLTQQSKDEQIRILGKKGYSTFSTTGRLNSALNVTVV